MQGTRVVRRTLALAALLAPACGGSSSETPPPERPDSWQLELRRPKTEPPESKATREHADVAWGPHRRAVSTWGSGKPRNVVSLDAGVTEQ
jgi:hypothetical protein